MMKNQLMIGGLVTGLLFSVACSSPGTANTNTTTTTTTTTTNSANKAAAPANTSTTSNTTSTTSNTSTTSSAQANQDFTLVNKTGVEIDKLYVSPHDADDWEEDILGQDTLPDGASVDIKFSRDEKAPMWDMRIEDKQGNAIEWENLNLMQIAKITLHYKDGKATAETE